MSPTGCRIAPGVGLGRVTGAGVTGAVGAGAIVGAAGHTMISVCGRVERTKGRKTTGVGGSARSGSWDRGWNAGAQGVCAGRREPVASTYNLSGCMYEKSSLVGRGTRLALQHRSYVKLEVDFVPFGEVRRYVCPSSFQRHKQWF